MLVLTRSTGQSIKLGQEGNITFKVLSNDGTHIRIGIDAPKDITILREEVYNRNLQMNRTAETQYEQGAVLCVD